MPGPPPKPSHLRQRRNKKPTAATVTATDADKPDRRLRKHPDGKPWHPETVRWWKDVWASGMADRYTQTDANGLYALAMLKDKQWAEQSTSLASEIRLQEARFMLDPRSRYTSQVEFAKAEEVERKRKKPERAQSRTDPREVLKLGELKAVT